MLAAVATLSLGLVAGCGGTSKAGSSDPIVLGSLLTISNPAWQNADVAATNAAWEKYINQELGGIGGRKVSIVNCDDKGDGATATQCASNLLAKNIVAFVNNASLTFGQVVLPQTAAAKVASIGGNPITQQEYESPYVFPTTPGASGSYPALAVYFRSTGAKKLALVLPDTASGNGVGTMLTKLWTQLGGESAQTFPFDSTSPDFTPLLSRVAASKPDVVIEGASGGTAARMFKDMQTAGIDVPVGGTAAAAIKSVFQSAGPAADGKYFSFACKPDSVDGVDTKLYHHVMETYAPKQELSNQTCMAASSLEYMVKVLKGVQGPITKESVLAELNKKEAWNGFLSHAMSKDYVAAGSPSVLNPWQTVSQYKGGTFTPVSVDKSGPLADYIDVTDGIAWFRGTLASTK
ncbi:ABC transporter substrate-binding protein [Planosporangium sp. 12N6]|uniref:ABC transporter substrate-binding protein n=1 Tax=Planosporangium spinosum TaxID=3402278 RepID=UPI003CF81155